MLRVNKNYINPDKDPNEILSKEWIDWGNLLVDDGQCNNVTLHIDDDGNIIYNDDIKIPTSVLLKSKINDYYNNNPQDNIAAV